jgi:16S rRNA (adenine1518-N6/adenine1519-N6)-dimethyltransferase
VRRTDPETRSKGAHFLAAKPALDRVVAAANLKPGESALDVGAGGGSLTRRVAAAVQPGGTVLAIEKEHDLVEALRQMDWPGATVVQGDALRVGLPARIDAVVANPPFRILPGLLRRLLEHGFGRAVLVMPQELAQRLTAQPGGEEYGKLTVQMALRAKTALLFALKRSDFDPPPQVPSVVVQVTPKAPPAGLDWDLLDAVLDAAWEMRKKTLRHSLAPLAEAFGVPPQVVSQALEESSTRDRTALEAAPWEYAKLALALARLLAEEKEKGSEAGKGRARGA